jgi:hypothetical protein
LKKSMPIIFLIAFTLVGAALPAPLSAQELKQIDPIEQIQQIQQTNFAGQFLKDEAELWRSPLKIHRGDAKWLVPLGAGAAALLATDHAISDEARETEGLRPASRFMSNLGGGGPMLAASAGTYALGKLTHNAKAAETGKLAAAAVLHTELVARGLKLMFNRERPNKLDGQGAFWSGGRSFPSGHAASSFAFATVVADQYKNKPLIAVGAYGLAAAVSLSRIGGLNHFPSDVVIGATIGHLIGRYVLHHNKRSDEYVR